MVVFGATELPRVIVTLLVAFFPLVISIAWDSSRCRRICSSSAARSQPRACRSSTASGCPIRWFIFSGLKVAIALSAVGAVVAEFVNAGRGLGYQIVTSTAFFQVPVAFGALILLSIMGIVLFQAVVVIERVFFPWSTSDETTVA